jgi:DNA-binding SARP family transcriptional activator/tetratricopeptide (TPR) repeat protein
MVRVRVLGQVRIASGSDVLKVGAPRRCAVLSVLALRAGRVVSLGELVDAVWGEAAPVSAEGAIYTYVSDVRKLLGDVGAAKAVARGRVLAGDRSGYVLNLGSDDVDALYADRLRGRARRLAGSGEFEQAIEVVDEAVGLWRGEALAGVPGPFADTERVRLGELWWGLVEDRAQWRLAVGRHVEVATELSALVAEQPLRESLVRLAMTALYRSGRSADALEMFARVRAVLAEELGVDPAPALLDLHVRILRSDSDLLVESGAEGGDRSPAVAGGAVEGGSPSTVPAQLPHDVAQFTGRAEQLMWLRGVVADAQREPSEEQTTVAISAIDGLGGVGKTALAVHLGHQVADLFPDGQLYVDLRGFHPTATPLTAGEALTQLLYGLGVDARAIPAQVEAQSALLRSRLAGRRVLLLLDNALDTGQVVPLLPGASTTVVLVTSRSRLSGLVARHGARRLTLDVMSSEEAVLLLERVIGRERVARERAAAAELVELCDRLPLAIRIAAERVSERSGDSLADLVAELRTGSERLDVLAVGDDETTAVRAVFGWSYTALSPTAARMFRCLAAHPGDEMSSAAAAAAASLTLAAAKPPLRTLYEAHLIARVAPDRYRLHDLLREFAGERAVAEDGAAEHAAALARVLDYYTAGAAAACALMRPGLPRPPIDVIAGTFAVPEFGADPAAAIAWSTLERRNLLAAVAAGAAAGQHRRAWQLASRLRAFFELHPAPGQFECLTLAIDSARQDGDKVGLAILYHDRGATRYRLGMDGMEADARRAEALYLEIGDLGGAARAAANATTPIVLDIDRQDEAAALLLRLADLFTRAGDADGQAVWLGNLARVHLRRGDAVAALEAATRASELHDELGNVLHVVSCRVEVARALLRLGRLDEAFQLASGLVERARQIGSAILEAETSSVVSEYYALTGDWELCLQTATPWVELATGTDDECMALAGVGRALLGLGRTAEAEQHWKRALTRARETSGSVYGHDVLQIIQQAHELAGTHLSNNASAS